MTMTFHEFLRYLALVGTLMASIALVELVVPLYRRAGSRRGRAPANLALTILIFTLNWLLTTALAGFVLWFASQDLGLTALSRLPVLAQILLGVLILDFFTYVAHWAMHKIPLLWRLHRVHHSDPFLDVTTSFRTHPMEGLWRFAWTLVPALALGIPAQAVVIYRMISMINALLEHANVAVPRGVDRALSSVWVTPNMHKIHHSTAAQQTDSNYGNISSWFDRLFRTFTPTDRAFALEYGLHGTDPEQVRSLRSLLRMPFEPNQRVAGSPIAEQVRGT